MLTRSTCFPWSVLACSRQPSAARGAPVHGGAAPWRSSRAASTRRDDARCCARPNAVARSGHGAPQNWFACQPISFWARFGSVGAAPPRSLFGHVSRMYRSAACGPTTHFVRISHSNVRTIASSSKRRSIDRIGCAALMVFDRTAPIASEEFELSRMMKCP